MKLTARERLIKTLNHEDPGQVVVDLGATGCSHIHVEALARVRAALGLEDKMLKVSPFGFFSAIEDDVKEALGIDVSCVQSEGGAFSMGGGGWRPMRLPRGLDVLVPDSFKPSKDEAGALYFHPNNDWSIPPTAKMPADGWFFDSLPRKVTDFDEDTASGREDFKNDFKIYTDEQLRSLERNAERAYNETEQGLILGDNLATFGDFAFLTAMWLPEVHGIRNFEDWLVAHYTMPEYIHEVYDLQCEVSIENMKLIHQAIGNKVQAAFVSGTDFGTQHSLYMSRDMYREFYAPYHKIINDWIHKNTEWKTFYHCCGAITELIDDFIDVGVDILNPVQCSADGMDPVMLKKRFGDRIVFWGAGSNTQQTLPFGTPEEVYAETTERLNIFAPGGGFVFSAIHCIQAPTPAENILAMFQAVKDYNSKIK